MPGRRSPPPRSSQLPPSPAGSARHRRTRKRPNFYEEWISELCDQDISSENVVTSQSADSEMGGASKQQLGEDGNQLGAAAEGHVSAHESDGEDDDGFAQAMQGGAGPQLVAPVLQAGVAVDDDEESVAVTPPVSPRDSNNTSQQSVHLTPPPSSPDLVLSLTPVIVPTPLSGQGAVPPVQQGDLHGDDHGQHGMESQASQQQAVPTQHSAPSQASQDIPVSLDELPPYHVVHRQHIPTITHIPKAARSDWTRLYTSVCWRVANNPANLANHILYSMLARVILPAGKAPPHPGDSTQATKIKERIRRWKAGEFRALWEEAIAMQKMPANKKRKMKQQQTVVTQEERNAVRSSRLVKECLA